MEFFCVFQDVYSDDNYDSGINNLPFQVILEPKADINKKRIKKFPFTIEINYDIFSIN